MKKLHCLFIGMTFIVMIGCSGSAPQEKPTGQIDNKANDLASAKPTTANDKFNRFNAPN
ncbi:MAG: hypothetical protein H7Y17_16095 [Chlorobia bacterium]|nr:hypothetical protein [Fimbriimonadaceae bacterium]